MCGPTGAHHGAVNALIRSLTVLFHTLSEYGKFLCAICTILVKNQPVFTGVLCLPSQIRTETSRVIGTVRL